MLIFNQEHESQDNPRFLLLIYEYEFPGIDLAAYFVQSEGIVPKSNYLQEVKPLSALYFLLFWVVFATSCKKKPPEKDESYPTIQLIKPSLGSVYHVFDTIRIQADINDDKIIKVVNVRLTDLQQVPVQTTVSFSPGTSHFNLNIGYDIYEHHLKSGYYYLNFFVSDGENDIAFSRTIYVHQSPTIKLGYYIFSNGSNTYNTVQTDTNFIQKDNKTFSGLYNGSAIGYYYQQLYLNGNLTEPFRAFEFNKANPLWTYNNPNPGTAYFSHVNSDDKNVYIAHTDGKVIQYDHLGTPKIQYTYSNTEFYPVYSAVQDLRHTAIFQSKVNPVLKKLIDFNASNGVALKEVPVNLSVVNIFLKSAGESYIVANDQAGFGELLLYTSTTGILSSIATLNSAKIISSCQISSTKLLIAMDDDTVYEYDNKTGNVIPLLNGIKVNKLRYSEPENLIYIASGNQLQLFKAGQYAAPVKTFTHAQVIIDFQIIMNK